MDSSLILFVRTAVIGETRVGSIYKDDLAERRLKKGDIYRIAPSYNIGRGTYISSVLAGFHHETLANAFNVSREEVEEIFDSNIEGPIEHVSDICSRDIALSPTATQSSDPSSYEHRCCRKLQQNLCFHQVDSPSPRSVAGIK
ncbi:hypothetical protein Q3G72_010463 [Acer saccharum]|nr:hypothetical protein Q3G72_010463 [Acer saccharum]